MQRSCKPQVEGSNPFVGSLAQPAYQTTLAWIHETGFSDLAEAAARQAADALQQAAIRAGHDGQSDIPWRVVDLGCGGGTMLDALTRRRIAGRKVVGHGVDLSPAMVGLARRRVPAASFEVASVLDAAIPACDGVTAIGEIPNYALAGLDAAAREKALRALFARVHAALPRGGFFLFDAATTAKAQGTRHVERQGRGWRIAATVDVVGDQLTRTIEAWDLRGPTPVRSHEVHHQVLLDCALVVRLLADAAFVVEVLGGYDDHALQVGWDAYLARVD